MNYPMRGRPRALIALALSLAIYAVPIVSAHWMGLFGPTLASELTSDRPAQWIAADVALALAAQAVLGVLAWIALGWGRLPGVVVLILTWLPAVYAVNVAYMVRIPAMFLIEVDSLRSTVPQLLHCIRALAELHFRIATTVDRRP